MIQRETIEDALENDRCGICHSVDHFREDCPLFTQGDLVGVARDQNGVDTATCECGFVELITGDGNYLFVPTGLYRFDVDAEHSMVSQVHQYRYICPDCWAKLPEE